MPFLLPARGQGPSGQNHGSSRFTVQACHSFEPPKKGGMPVLNSARFSAFWIHPGPFLATPPGTTITFIATPIPPGMPAFSRNKKIPFTHNSPFSKFNPPKSEFLVRQVKPERSSWLRNQPDKVSRPSEPSFASMRVTVGVKRKQGDSRP
jgi:hypothetical protein